MFALIFGVIAVSILLFLALLLVEKIIDLIDTIINRLKGE